MDRVPANSAPQRRDAPTGAPDDGIPLLRARAGGPATRFASALSQRPPALVFLLALLTGFAGLVAVSVVVGLLVTGVLAQPSLLGGEDRSAVRSIVAERTPTLTDVSAIGSAIGGGAVLPIVAGLVALASAIARRWRLAAFAALVLVVESATYRATSLLLPRDRPAVERLENLPADASYPSGHTAAAIAVYAGLALLLGSRVPRPWVRIPAWTIAILLIAFVAASRIYRGMHHPLDITGGVVVGIAALATLLFAVRASSAAAAPAAQTQRTATRATASTETVGA